MPNGLQLAAAVGLACLAMTGAPAMAADAGTQRVLALEPRLSFTQTFSDNHDNSATGDSDAISRLTAGVGFRGRTGAVRGFLDYSLSGLVYARHRESNSLQNALNANLVADVIENRVQLLGSASISRTAISAFGAQPGGGTDANANTTEVRTIRLAPTFRGFFGPSVRYGASLSHTLTSAADSGLGDVSTTNAAVHLEPTTAARLTWAVDASHLVSDYKRGRETSTDRLLGALRFDLNELDLQLSATGGAERTNLSSLDAQVYSNWGLGLQWIPSPRTRFSADIENRFFGRSHAIGLEHRTQRTSFRIRSARSLSTSGEQAGGLQGPAADVFDSLLQSRFPDAAQRDSAVRSLLERVGLADDPGRIIATGFLQSSATVQDLLEVSAAWTGQRDTAVLTLSRSKSRRADQFTSVADDLSQSSSVVQTNLAFNLGHRLTPLSSLALTLAAQRSQGDAAVQSSRRISADLQFSTQLTPESSATVTFRRAQFRTALQPYGATALVASYGLRF